MSKFLLKYVRWKTRFDVCFYPLEMNIVLEGRVFKKKTFKYKWEIKGVSLKIDFYFDGPVI
jgi:hypothetical protein